MPKSKEAKKPSSMKKKSKPKENKTDNKKESSEKRKAARRKPYNTERYYICTVQLGKANKHLWCAAHGAGHRPCIRRSLREKDWFSFIGMIVLTDLQRTFDAE
jgi:hypothetical protein